MPRIFERRIVPIDSPLALAATTALAVVAAMLAAALLFVVIGVDPLDAYAQMLREAFATPRGFGFSLVRGAPLAFIALGTIVSWRSGFAYLGFEGCFVLGAAAATWFGLLTIAGSPIGPLPFAVFLPLAMIVSFLAGGVWAGIVGLVRVPLGGNEVLISLMTNYVAILLVQYLISGPMRAPGGLPQSPRLPLATWLPFIIPGTRAHAGILIAIVACFLVWLLLRKTVLGYELIVSGLSLAAARYGGIDVKRRIVLAAVFAGGLASCRASSCRSCWPASCRAATASTCLPSSGHARPGPPLPAS